MAHGNIVERRNEVAKLMQSTYTTDDLKSIAKKYGCSRTAVFMDIVYMGSKNDHSIFVKPSMKRHVFKRDDYTCQYCLSKGDLLVIEHVVPQSVGGDAREGNLVTACCSCNSKKKGGKVWIPKNIHVLQSLDPEWTKIIIERAVKY